MNIPRVSFQFFQQFQEFKLRSKDSMKVSPPSFFHHLYIIYSQFLKLYIIYADYVVIISCVILLVLFSIQHHGTHRVAFMFAPLLATWLLCISGIGVYNRFYWNRHIYRALSPLYMLKFLRATGIEGRMSLGGVVLSITGTYHIVFVFYCIRTYNIVNFINN